jgi:hypothetical protein
VDFCKGYNGTFVKASLPEAPHPTYLADLLPNKKNSTKSAAAAHLVLFLLQLQLVSHLFQFASFHILHECQPFLQVQMMSGNWHYAKTWHS